METEQGYEAEQDQGHFAEQGKPPHHSTEILLSSQACFVFQNKIMHVLFPLWHLATQKLVYKMLFGQRYLLVYNRFYKNKSLLEKSSTEGAIKKIIFSSSISL